MPASMATSRNQGPPKLVLLSLPPLPSHLPPLQEDRAFLEPWSTWQGRSVVEWLVDTKGGKQKKFVFRERIFFGDSISVWKAFLWWRHSSQNTSFMQYNCLCRMMSRLFMNLSVSMGCHTFGPSQNFLTSEGDKPQPVCAEWRPDSSQNRDGEGMVVQFRKSSSQNWLQIDGLFTKPLVTGLDPSQNQ